MPCFPEPPAARSSVSEMARAGKRHSHALLVGGRNHFRVTHRSARLNGRRRPRFCCRDKSVGEREKRVAANHAARQRKTGLARLPDRNPAGVHTAHLARADSQRAVRRGKDNGVGFDMLDDASSQTSLPAAPPRWAALRDTRQICAGSAAASGSCARNESAPTLRTFQRLAASRPLSALRNRRLLLLLQQRQGVGGEIGGDDDFAENLRHRLRAGQVQGLVDGDDAAKRGLPVGGQGLLPGLAQGGALAGAARVGMFDNGQGRGSPANSATSPAAAVKSRILL